MTWLRTQLLKVASVKFVLQQDDHTGIYGITVHHLLPLLVSAGVFRRL